MGAQTTPPAQPVGADVVVGVPAFVAAKIATPDVGPASVRPEVLDSVRAGGEKRLLLVRAPAGYGKTAVISEAARRLDWRSVWYKLDVLDHDPAVLVASIVQAVRRLEPDFGEILIQRFAGSSDAPMKPAEMVGLLAAELQNEVSEPLHLILDDYHEAVGSTGLNETLDRLVASLPAHIHMVLLTRCRPAMATSRLKLEDQLTEIAFDDLRFDADQLAEVLLERTGLRLTDDQAVRLVRLTEGWPASVVLIGRALDWSDLDSIEAALADPRITSDIFSYLSEEAVRHEDAEVAAFMTATCCLDSMTVDLANQVARTHAAPRLLDGLVSRNVFTFLDLSSGTYRYHQLFRDYLRHRFIQEQGKDAFHELQLWTAEAVEQAGDREMAIELCFAANEPAAALAVVSRSGELVTDDCRLETLDAWLERLPLHLRDRDPWALFLRAQRSLREGRGDDALEVLDRALVLFEERDDRSGAYHALSSMEAIHFWKGAFRQAATYCEKALAVAETPLQRMHTTVSLGSAHSYLCDWEASQRLWREAESIAPDACGGELLRIEALRANAVYLQGQMVEAGDYLVRLLRRELTDASPSFSVAVLGVLVDIKRELAEYDEARRYARQCLDLCDRYGLVHLRHGVETGEAAFGDSLGNGLVACEQLKRLRDDRRVREDAWLMTHILMSLSATQRHLGDLTASVDSIVEATRWATRQDTRILVLASEAASAFARGLTGEAVRLDLIEKEAASNGLALVALAATFWRAVLAHDRQDCAAATALLRDCVPRQLALGHNNFLVTEMSTYHEIGVIVLEDRQLQMERGKILELLARTRLADSLLTACIERSEDLASAVISCALPHLDEERCVALLRALRKHSSSAVRRAAWRIKRADGGAGRKSLSPLSRRELQVLALIADGARNREIAKRLFLSETTVKTHINHIFTKLGVTDRIQAVLYYKETIEPTAPENTTVD